MCFIGVTTSIKTVKAVEEETSANYLNAVSKAGGQPVFLTPETFKKSFEGLENSLDGVVITGGYDINPEIYGENPHKELRETDDERDFFEKKLLEYCLENKIPVLAICRGMQLLNVVQGGNLNQHLTTFIQHSQEEEDPVPTHKVNIRNCSFLKQVFGSETMVNSHHHQGVGKLGEELCVAGKSPDKVVEALKYTGDTFCVGVQWHPEMMVNRKKEQLKLFEKFVGKCSEK